MGSSRLTVMADVYNAFNSDWVFSQNGTLGTNYAVSSTWLRPPTCCTARMFKLGAQFELLRRRSGGRENEAGQFRNCPPSTSVTARTSNLP